MVIMAEAEWPQDILATLKFIDTKTLGLMRRQQIANTIRIIMNMNKENLSQSVKSQLIKT